MMKPWCMSWANGASQLKGCFPVRRTMDGFRGTQLSDVASSLGSKIDGSSSLLPLRIKSKYSAPGLSFWSSSSEEEK